MKLETLQQNLATNLISLRKKAGLKQKDLALLINYSDKSISKWERQEGIPDLYAANCLASCFGVSVDYLISSHDEQSVAADHTVQRSFNERMLILVVILSI